MPSINEEVAAAFQELADLLELIEGERFRILAYRRAAATISGLGRDLKSVSDTELMSIRGIGKATASKIKEVLETGSMKTLEEVRSQIPAGVLEMKSLPGLGPKKAMKLHRELGVNSIEELQHAIEVGALRELKGMGVRSEETLLEAIRRRHSTGKRHLLESSTELAEEILSELQELPVVTRAEYAGSLRRVKETIGDIDILAASSEPEAVMDRFTSMRVARKSGNLVRGSTKSSIRTKGGLQVDLRVVAPDEFGAALQYFTGSQAHNVRVREIAVKKGLKLSEYGIFRVEGGERLASQTEEEVYAALGMSTPLPTMRENRGEVELALAEGLPDVVALRDIKGDLHAHTTYSDGTASVAEMVESAAAQGYSYFALTDHGGGRWPFNPQLIERQRKEIEKAGIAVRGQMVVLQGVEMSIRPDGAFAFPDGLLASFDLVIASVHESMGQERSAMTERLIRALEHPEVNILGHPTARRLMQRPAIEYDLETVFKTAAANSVALEISGHPERLDLKDDHIHLARELGCLFAINTDSHGPGRLNRMKFGVGMAQRGWAKAKDVINTWPLDRLQEFFQKTL